MWIARAFSEAVVASVVLVLTAAVALPAIKHSFGEPKRPVLVVRDIDPGGMIGTYDMWWHRVADSGVLVVVDGDCVSACALMMGIVPPQNVCLTDRATFGLHMASSVNKDGERGPDQAVTEWMIRRYYPVVVKDWIAAHDGLKPEVIYMHPADFKGYYRKCNREEYDPWPVESSR